MFHSLGSAASPHLRPINTLHLSPHAPQLSPNQLKQSILQHGEPAAKVCTSRHSYLANHDADPSSNAASGKPAPNNHPPQEHPRIALRPPRLRPPNKRRHKTNPPSSQAIFGHNAPVRVVTRATDEELQRAPRRALQLHRTMASMPQR